MGKKKSRKKKNPKKPYKIEQLKRKSMKTK